MVVDAGERRKFDYLSLTGNQSGVRAFFVRCHLNFRVEKLREARIVGHVLKV
jgi:hypothetical protein